MNVSYQDLLRFQEDQTYMQEPLDQSWKKKKVEYLNECGQKMVINYLFTESEVFTGKSQTETLPYLP